MLALLYITPGLNDALMGSFGRYEVRRIGLMLMLFIVAVTTLLSQRIVVAVMQDPDFLDPHRAAASGTYEMMFNVFEGLLKPTLMVL